MTACRCEACCPADPALTYTEAHRHQCEARHLATLPKDSQRAAHLDAVEKKAGKAAANALRQAVWEIMRGNRGRR
jgi:hypothetical protein